MLDFAHSPTINFAPSLTHLQLHFLSQSRRDLHFAIMQLSALPFAVAALVLVGQTTAVKCTTGVKYCGHTLYNMRKFASSRNYLPCLVH